MLVRISDDDHDNDNIHNNHDDRDGDGDYYDVNILFNLFRHDADDKTDDDLANDVGDLSMICQCQGGGEGGVMMLTRWGLFYGLFTPDVSGQHILSLIIMRMRTRKIIRVDMITID